MMTHTQTERQNHKVKGIPSSLSWLVKNMGQEHKVEVGEGGAGNNARHAIMVGKKSGQYVGV